MSQQTFIKPDDIVSTLQSYQLVQYWKGQVRPDGTPSAAPLPTGTPQTTFGDVRRLG
eukprot:COSAG01_NODE_9970_length_2288_cov_11.761207_4_plen_57_part_00